MIEVVVVAKDKIHNSSQLNYTVPRRQSHSSGAAAATTINSNNVLVCCMVKNYDDGNFVLLSTKYFDVSSKVQIVGAK